MNTKLTLTIDKAVIQKAKKHASRKGRSLSDLVSNYLKAVSHEESDAETEISPLVQSLKGSFTASMEMDYKQELSSILQEKYLKK